MRVLITDGNQRATLAVVRSLGSKGHRVVVGETTRTSLASRSRHCAEAVAYPPWDKDPRGFIEALEHMVGRGGFDLLLPMTDPTVFLVTRHRDALEKYARIPFPDHATFARASNKYEMYRLAVSLGVPVPRTAVLESAGGQVPDAAEDLGYPLVVKPHASWVEHGDGLTGFSVRFAADQEALADIMAGTPPEAYPLLLQEGISGSGIGYFCLFAGGKPLAEFFHRRIRERPAWGGESVLREAAAPDPALRAHSVALLSELGWTGPAMCEYKLDRRDGSPRLMEINGRFWGSLQLAIDAGVDFPDLLVRAIEGKSLSPDAGYRIGVRSRWLLGDADALLGVLAGSAPKGRPVPGRGRALWDFLRPSGPKTRLEAARIGDPGPFVYELSRFTSKLLRLVGGKLAGRLAPSRSRPFGMLHCHTTYSYDGEASPKQIVDFLRGLGARFLALNEHVQSMTPESVAQMVEECRRLSGPDFVVVPGLEYSLEGIGHVIALGLEDYIPNEGSPLEIIREIKRRGALPVLAHPYPGDPDPAPEILLELAGVETWNTLHDGGYVPRPASMDRIERYRKINPALRDFQGSDLHRFSSFKPVFVTIPPGPLTKERILDCLRSGTFRVRAKMISYRSLIETGPVKRAYIRAVFGLLERVRPLWRKARDRFGVPCWRYFGCDREDCVARSNPYKGKHCWMYAGSFSDTDPDSRPAPRASECSQCEYYLSRNADSPGAAPKLRVLHLIETGNPGGAEYMILSLVRSLDPERFASRVCLLKRGWLFDEMSALDVPVHVQPLGRGLDIRFLYRLIRYIRRQKIDLVHSHEFAMNVYSFLASRIARIPSISTVHGNLEYLDRWRRRAAYRLVARRGDRMITVSESLREDLHRRLSRAGDRIEVIHNGVPILEPVEIGDDGEGYRKQFGLSDSARVMATVGSLYPIKGHRYLIAAIPRVLEQVPEATLLVIGRGSLLANLKRQAAELGVAGSVIFTGFRQDIAGLLGFVEFVIQPSLYEGLSMLILEAMSAGKAVVATDVGGNSQLINDGENGLLVEAKYPEALAQAMIQLLSDREAAVSFGEEGRRVAREKFDLKLMVRRYENLYTLLARPGEDA